MKHLSLKKKTKRFFDIPRWIGAEHIGSQFRNIRALMHALTTTPTPEREETYEEAMVRMNLSAEDMDKRKQTLFIMSMVYVALGSLVIAYAIFLFCHEKWMATVMCIPITSVLFSFAFREHFWYIQLKHKRLGFTFKEWWKALLGNA